MPRYCPSIASQRLRAGGAVLIAFALLLAQELGLLHRQLHGVGLAPPAVAAPRHAAVPGAPGHHAAWHADARSVGAKAEPVAAGDSGPVAALPALFAPHEAGGLQCRLYDQLAHADLATVDAPAAVAFAAAQPPALRPALPAHRREARAFDARGPPAGKGSA